jgi:hypothetical protein
MNIRRRAGKEDHKISRMTDTEIKALGDRSPSLYIPSDDTVLFYMESRQRVDRRRALDQVVAKIREHSSSSPPRESIFLQLRFPKRLHFPHRLI